MVFLLSPLLPYNALIKLASDSAKHISLSLLKPLMTSYFTQDAIVLSKPTITYTICTYHKHTYIFLVSSLPLPRPFGLPWWLRR